MEPLKTFTNLPAMQARQKIPPAKRRAQVGKTLLGGGIIVGGLLLPKALDYPYWVGLLGVGVGAFLISQQFVFDVIKAIGQLMAAIGGKNSE